MPALSVMIKPASGLCNMSCEYCFYCDEGRKREQASFGLMTEETLRNVIRRTMPYAQGQIAYAFQGGEPSLRGLAFFEKAVEYQQRYNRNGVTVTNAFQTNGYAIDADWCRFFADHHFLVGLSVDGIQDTHDRFRHDASGGPTYARVIETAALLDRYGAEYNILTVVNRETAARIEEIYEDYGRRGWMYQQYIACLDPMDTERGQMPYSLTPLEYGQFLTRLFELWYQDWKREKQPYIRAFDNYIGILMGYRPEACEQRGHCVSQCVVEADGSVYPCDFYALDAWKLGNFNTDRLEQIFTDPRIRTFEERSRNLDPACRDCRHYDLCRGGCQRCRDLTSAGYYGNYFCEGFQYFFDRCRPQMLAVAETIQKGAAK